MRFSSAEIVRCRPWLGTFVKIRAAGLPASVLDTAVARGFAAIERVHRLMSAHDMTSELARLNACAAARPVRVSSGTYAVLRLARRMHVASRGAFDVAVAPRLSSWGYLSPGTGSTAGTTADIEFGPKRSITFRRRLRIDLGGIAKGYAVDCAVRALIRSGVASGAVDAGGDLRVFGTRMETVHVRDPRQPFSAIAALQLRNAAVATSAAYFSERRIGGRHRSALVDPRSGRPHVAVSSVTVAAPTCAVADALTKAVLFMPDAESLLRRYHASALIVGPSGDTTTMGVQDAA